MTNAPRLPTIAVSGLAGLAALALTGCGVDVHIGGDATTRVESETVGVDGLATVEIDTDDGAVTVRGADVDEVSIDIALRESDEGDADYTIDHDGDRLVVRGECDAGFLDECSVGFDVVVPTGLEVVVHTDNGAVDVSAIDGAVDLESDNGRIDVLDVDGDLTVDTDNGRIGGERLRSPHVDAHSDNGRIDLAFAEAPATVVATTDNGAIEVLVPDSEAGYDVDAGSQNGDVDVDVDERPGSDRTIVATSDNGSVTVGTAGLS